MSSSSPQATIPFCPNADVPPAAPPSLVDCLVVVGCRLLHHLGGADLDRICVVMASHEPTRALLEDTVLWAHLFAEAFPEPPPSILNAAAAASPTIPLRPPHHPYLHMSYHCEWFHAHVHVVRGAIELDAPPNESAMDALIFPTTPSLLRPQPTSVAHAVHALGGPPLQTELVQVHVARGGANVRAFRAGSAVVTSGGAATDRFHHFVHCVGPQSNQSADDKMQVLAATYLDAFSKLISLRLRRVVVVPVGTGIAACPVARTADMTMHLLWQIVWAFCHCPQREDQAAPAVDGETPPRFPLADVVFLCRDDALLDAFVAAKRACGDGWARREGSDGDIDMMGDSSDSDLDDAVDDDEDDDNDGIQGEGVV
ncbi:Aste57867_25140 [Aphanomyces stellatus]|uniref:Aste57867_25140 protein n=1 Tax=Aphanomyces stellatus TaxID=120398 RepID=A0A485LSE6_9STRA|nr:hypothetical protein As57867_025062 [Aphanomyces stellatus]VFU01770.1 Aste57867_25140 [Aphanomyces stellatus]